MESFRNRHLEQASKRLTNLLIIHMVVTYSAKLDANHTYPNGISPRDRSAFVDINHSSKKSNITIDKTDKPITKNIEPESVSFVELFSQANSYDYFLMTLGLLGAIVTGVSSPVFNIIFGKVLDTLNTNPESFSNEISQLALDFFYIGLANFISGLLQVSCFTIVGERQTQRYRELYVKAILSQELG